MADKNDAENVFWHIICLIAIEQRKEGNFKTHSVKK